ncbi:MAG: multicopper oxidase domain-containing protein [Acidobacteria bacterium]|nr:multicopper oxidase domain-containing protein [Acidobacteriota bacterium]
MKQRRDFFRKLAAWGGGAWAGRDVLRAQPPPVPVEVPGVPKLPFEVVDGAKEFHLVAEPVRVELVKGRVMDLWGYNGSMPGPTIEVHQGDRVRIVFENRLPEMTTVHWHGLEVPIEMDGVPGISQDPVPPGGRFTYEFTLHQHGSFFYHSHMAMQQMFGMIGWFIIHPKQNYLPAVDRDYGYILQEFALLPNNTVPNTLSMEFNWLTMNGRSGPHIIPAVCRVGERVRFRFVNLGMDHHPMHLHGYQWTMTGTEGGRVPETAWIRGNTTLVGVAQVRTVEVEATNPGDWMLHCHLPHHGMNQMVSMVGPMSHGGAGMISGGSMEHGMGIVGGAALADHNGPALGRGLGMAADAERPTSTMVARPEQAANPATDHSAHHPPEHAHHGATVAPAPDAGLTPGFPQDMWMPMDEDYADEPRNHGLRQGWTAATMGMMTYLRVLDDAGFDHIAQLERERREKA